MQLAQLIDEERVEIVGLITNIDLAEPLPASILAAAALRNTLKWVQIIFQVAGCHSNRAMITIGLR